MPRDGNVSNLADLFAHAGIAMVEFDLAGRIVRSNDPFRRIVGYPGEKLAGLDPLLFLHPDDRARVRQVSGEFAAGERDRGRLERRVVRPDGTIRWARVTASLARDPEGRPDGVLALVEDVTEHHEADGALRHAEEICASITGSCPDHVMILDLDGRIRFINRTVPDLTVEGVLGRRAIEFVPERCRGAMQACHDRVIRTREDGCYEVDYVAADGKVHTFVTRVWPVLRNGEVTALTQCATDVTAHRLLERQFLHAQKMESIGRLAGGIAHDLNNQLSIILGSTELAMRGGPGAPAVAAELRRIESAAERAAALTQQLLAFGRKQVLHTRLLGLNSLVAGVRDMVDRILGEDIRLRLQLGRVGQVRVDPVQIEQVLLNLVINACDAMPDGGTLVISTEEVAVPEGHVALPAGRYALLRVADTGIGMDQETLARAFEPFFTTKEVGKGTGLGLAVVHGVVTQSGGHIEAESAPGAGATFRIHLPIAEGEAEPERGRPSCPAAGGTETILVVEDEPRVLDITRRVLEERGYRVVAASSGDEALARLASVPEIRLLLTDVVMPGMDGQELASRVLRAHPQIRVVLLTGYEVGPRPDVAPHLVLQKPVAAALLATRIREVLDMPQPVRA
ncbi:MAG TPA: PAS domain S-box protein [Planctomycetota bacterium]|nr:PAS domain S-box protein [Planctomycetota bacterium]